MQGKKRIRITEIPVLDEDGNIKRRHIDCRERKKEYDNERERIKQLLLEKRLNRTNISKNKKDGLNHEITYVKSILLYND